ncbi:MAG: STAS domain-containing protein [Leptospiraceae bacterium]|nr:STAS domain-containing protein [Leptospiraceae bacterium]MDW8305794.1 STAS domain-containing protein [Leptospiraceae bacterium]
MLIEKLAQKNGKVLLKLTGELTIREVKEVKEIFNEYLSSNEMLVLDLSGVGELDSCGFQLLYALKIYAKKKNKKLKYVNHSEAVLRYFDLYGVLAFFADKIKIPKELRAKLDLTYSIQR